MSPSSSISTFFNKYKSKFDKLRVVSYYKESHFLKHGLPFFIFIIGLSFIAPEFQKPAFYHKKHVDEMNKLQYAMSGGDKFDITEELKKVQQVRGAYQNIRGPRPYEDNEEFHRTKEEAQKRAEKFM